MLLPCIHLRFTNASTRHMTANAMRGRYGYFVIATGLTCAINPQFGALQAAFWNNIDITANLRSIKRVVAMTTATAARPSSRSAMRPWRRGRLRTHRIARRCAASQCGSGSGRSREDG